MIRYLFGRDVQPLTRVHLNNSQRSNVDMDLKVDEFLLRHRAPLSLRQMLERYQRSLPAPGEKLVLSETDETDIEKTTETLTP